MLTRGATHIKPLPFPSSMKGVLLAGSYDELIARQKAEDAFELGELLVTEENTLLQVYDLAFGSQLTGQNLELISGMKLEEDTDISFMDPHLRNYTLARLRSLATLGKNPKTAKALPRFFSPLRPIEAKDVAFAKPAKPLFIGNLRSGSRVLDVPLFLPGPEALSHHVLIPATTGRGKSNLLKCLLWKLAFESYAGMLVVDPHDEYYEALRDHPEGRVKYYSPTPEPGTDTLVFSLKDVQPTHFQGAVDWSQPQQDALYSYWKKYGKEWVEAIVLEKPLDNNFHEATLNVIRRKVMQLLNLNWDGQQLHCEGCFKLEAGSAVIKDIVRAITEAKIVIVDTSSFDGAEEILIGSLITTELFRHYKRAKLDGTLKDKPVASIVLEEAPRVLGKEVLEKGRNIFSTIAREGRKFKVGLVAITQLPSLIPRQILANMNTKIILGIEMKPERQAVIDSAAQDLSQDDRAIASLDKGEAIVTSNFAPFALPTKIPLFKDLAKPEKKNMSYPGLS